jgi:hypothetical protein
MRLSSVSFRRLLDLVAMETKGERREIFPITASEEKSTRLYATFAAQRSRSGISAIRSLFAIH